nr:hypothetical protein Hi04_10k_c2294_00013 [uncultured bacterium]
MADDALKKLEDRLTRLEAALSQGGAAAGFPPGGAVVDPGPWPGGGWGWHPTWPHPVVDPAAFYRPVVDPAAYHRPVVDPAAYHRPVVDPAAYHRPVVDPAAYPRPVVDPAAYPRPIVDPAAFARIGYVGGDPPPPDVSRFSSAQLQASLHSIAAERARLDAMETLIRQQLERE